jgi:hypothetical protein
MKRRYLSALLLILGVQHATAQQPVIELDSSQCNWTWTVYLPPPLNVTGIPTTTDQFQIAGRVGGPFAKNAAGDVYAGAFTTGEITYFPDIEGYFPGGAGGGNWATFRIYDVIMRKESLPLDFGIKATADGSYAGDHWFHFLSGTAEINIVGGSNFIVPIDGLDSLPLYQTGQFTTNSDGSLHLEASESHAFQLFDPTSSLTFDMTLTGIFYGDEVFDIITFCTGDGSGTMCPCGNAAAAGEGCMNGTGQGGLLDSGGTSSISDNTFVLRGTQMTPSQPGLYFQGNNAVNSGNGNPFGDGLRCAGGGVRRLQVRFADATGTSQTSISIGAAGAVAAGDTKRYQVWYRDPLMSFCGFGFNLTNGIEVTWGA